MPPGGSPVILAQVCNGPDARLMASAPVLWHEIARTLEFLERLVHRPVLVDALVEATNSTEVEAALYQRVGALRRAAHLAGAPVLGGGTAAYDQTLTDLRDWVTDLADRIRALRVPTAEREA